MLQFLIVFIGRVPKRLLGISAGIEFCIDITRIHPSILKVSRLFLSRTRLPGDKMAKMTTGTLLSTLKLAARPQNFRTARFDHVLDLSTPLFRSSFFFEILHVS